MSYLSLCGREWGGWALIRGWALINFFCLWDGRLFEVGANSRLGAYSNKYGNTITYFVDQKDCGLWERDCTITKTQASFKHAHNHFLSDSNSRGHLFRRC